MRFTVNARRTRRCRSTRERTHILTLMRLLPLALPRGTIPALYLRACELLRQCNVVQIYAPPFARSTPVTMSPVTFQINVNVIRQAS